MKILALEFSSPQRSVAVVTSSDDRPLRDSQEVSKIPVQGCTVSETGRGIAEFSSPILPVLSATPAVSVSEVIESGSGRMMKPLDMIEETLRLAGLKREQIECLAIGLGPGSYTGIRTAIALAQGWQLASGVKLLGVSSADCVAAQAQADGFRGTVSVVLDAQRGEFCLAGYELGACVCRQTAPLRLAVLAEAIKQAQASEVLIGPEATRCFPGGRVVFPRAATLGKLALGRTDFVAGEKLEPLYLREAKFVKATTPRTIPF
jgi:tRNA threonylcarbamoyl adenosine modification protein YeaZ